ncbi:MAG: nucleotide exchange factor GrpE [Thermoguttaceae bacterium]
MKTAKKKNTIDFVSEPDLDSAVIPPSETGLDQEREQGVDRKKDHKATHHRGHHQEDGDPDELESLRAELEETKDRMLRARAELENFRARINRQIETDQKYASLELIRDILPAWDNLGRALQAADSERGSEGLAEGVRLVYEQFEDIFKKHHCVRISALYEPFDPNFEESIAMIPCADYPPNTVIEETLCGFRLHDRVVRPAQVVLAAPARNS